MSVLEQFDPDPSLLDDSAAQLADVIALPCRPDRLSRAGRPASATARRSDTATVTPLRRLAAVDTTAFDTTAAPTPATTPLPDSAPALRVVSPAPALHVFRSRSPLELAAAELPTIRGALDVDAGQLAGVLAGLGAGWHLLHAVPVGNRTTPLDHLAIGPGGVFAITTAHHPKSDVHVRGEIVRVDGAGRNVVRTGRVQAALSATLLTRATGTGVAVRGLIAVTGAGARLTVTAQPLGDQIGVLDARDVVSHLASRPTELTPDVVETIAEAAQRRNTWLPTGTV